MSRTKTATRRLSLLAGSSLVVASLTAFGGVMLAPATAHAYDECVPNAATTQTDGVGGVQDVTLNGATNDLFTCSGAIASITYPSISGNLTLQLQGSLAVTNGISINGTGIQTITLTRINAELEPGIGTGDPQISNSAGAAINVERTTAGTVTLTLNDTETVGDHGVLRDYLDTPMAITGTSAGIRVRNIGSGATTVTVGQGRNDRTNATVTATAGAGIDLASAGTGNFTINTGAIVTGTTAAISVASGGNVTITQQGPFNETGGELHGVITLGNTGNTTFTNRGLWTFNGVSTLRNTATTTGSATLTNFRTISTGAAATLNFGSGTGTFDQGGYLVAGEPAGASTLTLQGVDTFISRGVIVFGGAALQPDGETNDRIVLTNSTAATFDGREGGVLVMDVDFTASQAGCAAAVAADCLDLRGHNTTGVNTVLINPVATGFTAERIVLVDVAGAGSDAGSFTISPDTPGYRALGTGMIDTGLFLYEIDHDMTAKQHALAVAAVDQEAVELNLLGRAAMPAWDLATGSWFDRQADLRNSLREGTGSIGTWLKVTGAYATERKVSGLSIGGDRIDVVTNNTQDTLGIVGGVDLIGAETWVAGVTFGQISSELDFKENPNSIKFEGYSLGAYASYVGPAFFLDAIVGSTTLDATYEGASLGLRLNGEAESLGYRIEGGWRFDWSDGVFFEPLMALSYVSTELSDMPVASGTTAEFDELTSFRGSLGARLSGDIVFDGFSIQLAGLGRVWQEFEGEAKSAVVTGFGDFAFLDQAEETVSEVGFSLGVFGAGGRVSAQLSSGVEFRDGYQSVDVSLAGRYQW